jgi:RNA polymerase-binding transcription factor DksA
MDTLKQEPSFMTKNRYSDLELERFKSMIGLKLLSVNEQCSYLKSSINGSDSNGTDDTAWSMKMLEDGAEALSKEEINILYNKQLALKRDLEDALYRIDLKTYGVCVNTGELIPLDRLKAIPQALTTIKK